MSEADLALSNTPRPKKKKRLLNQTGQLKNDLLSEELHTSDTETTLELNFALIKLKHIIKYK